MRQLTSGTAGSVRISQLYCPGDNFWFISNKGTAKRLDVQWNNLFLLFLLEKKKKIAIPGHGIFEVLCRVTNWD